MYESRSFTRNQPQPRICCMTTNRVLIRAFAGLIVLGALDAMHRITQYDGPCFLAADTSYDYAAGQGGTRPMLWTRSDGQSYHSPDCSNESRVEPVWDDAAEPPLEA